MLKNATKFKFKTSYGFAITSDSRYMANIGDRSLQIYDSQSGKLLSTFKDLHNPSSVSVSHNCRLFAIKNTIGDVAQYNFERMSLDKVITVSKEGPRILFTPDDKYIIIPDRDGNIYLLETISDNNHLLESHPGCRINSVWYCCNKQFYFHVIEKGGGWQNYLLTWEYPFSKSNVKKLLLPDHTYDIRYNQKQDAYISVFKSNLVKLNSFLQGQNSITVELYANIAFDWSDSGDYIILISGDDVHIIDYKSFEIIRSFIVPGVRFAEFISADQDKSVFIGSISQSYYLDFESLLTS